MSKALSIAAVNAIRLGRDRVGLFFLFVFPIVLILLIGVSFGEGFEPKLGVVAPDGGELGDELVEALGGEEVLEIERLPDRGSLVDAVERGEVDAGVVIPPNYDSVLRAGDEATVEYVSPARTTTAAIRTTVNAVVTEKAARVRAASFAADRGAGGFDQAAEVARSVASQTPAIDVDVRSEGESTFAGLGQFDLGASSQLILFMFVNSLGATVALIQSRRLGVSRRMLSTPMTAGTIVVGETLGRFLIAMIQGVFIILAATLLFGVEWGDPLAASVLLTAFALVSTGAAMLFGAILSNEQQAGALTPLGLGLAALGGCMVPLEIFSPTMQTIAHITPHAWAVEGFTELIRTDAGIADVALQIGVLVSFAVVLLGVASWRLHQTITR
ncbi:MAG: ABC transporter permease [Actinomycetota bacterium]